MSRGAKARAYQQRHPEHRQSYHERRVHAIKRVAERYGLEMSAEDYEALCNCMPDAKSEERYLARRVPDPKERPEQRFYAVFWRKAERWVLAVYSFRSFQIVTFLPPESLPRDLPSPERALAFLEQGKALGQLRNQLLDRGRVPVSLAGEIAWDLVGMSAPETVAEARIYLHYLNTKIIDIETQLKVKSHKAASMSPGDYRAWLNEAKWSLAWRRSQAAALNAHIKMMEARARRLRDTNDTEAILLKARKQFSRMLLEGRITALTNEEGQLLDAMTNHLQELGWDENKNKKVESEA